MNVKHLFKDGLCNNKDYFQLLRKASASRRRTRDRSCHTVHGEKHELLFKCGPVLTDLVKFHRLFLVSCGFCLNSHVFGAGFIPTGACVEFMMDKQALN